MTSGRWRTLTMSAVAMLAVAGMDSRVSWGTLSGFGVGKFSAVCPLGYLETMLASRMFLPRLLVPFVVLMLLTVLLGRVFCGWICPVPLLRSWLPQQKKSGDGQAASNNAAANGELRVLAPPINGRNSALSPHRPQTGLYILAGTLLSSAVFGFPVFCLVCSIGLSFGALFAMLRLFRFNEPTVALVLFPAIVVVELVVLRKWCSQLCPLGALLGLMSKFNRSLVPSINQNLCLLTTKGTNCQACYNACEMNIDLRNESGAATNNCVKCRGCAEKCPVQAIRFPWWR